MKSHEYCRFKKLHPQLAVNISAAICCVWVTSVLIYKLARSYEDLKEGAPPATVFSLSFIAVLSTKNC